MSQAMLTVYTDASGDGMGYWFPSLNLGFQSHLPDGCPLGTIFFFEALAVTAAILDAVERLHPYDRLAVFTDNMNSVVMFNTLAALPPYNWLLLIAMDAILASHVDLRVFHVAGIHNTVADCLSRWKNEDAVQVSPGLTISPFQPPRNTLGASKK